MSCFIFDEQILNKPRIVVQENLKFDNLPVSNLIVLLMYGFRIVFLQYFNTDISMFSGSLDHR